jgi:hypothetical protein
MNERREPLDNLEKLIQVKTSLNAIKGFLEMDVSPKFQERRSGLLIRNGIELLRNLPERVSLLYLDQDYMIERESEEELQDGEVWDLNRVELYIIILEDQISTKD